MSATPQAEHEATLQLARWTVTSGSNARSRGAVVITSGDHEWRASAAGNGAIDALYRAVDKALQGVLSGHPRLLAYDIHALGEGTDTIGVVTVRIAPPVNGGERGSGEYGGEAGRPGTSSRHRSRPTSGPSTRCSPRHIGPGPPTPPRAAAARPYRPARRAPKRADIDEDEGQHDTVAWFER